MRHLQEHIKSERSFSCRLHPEGTVEDYQYKGVLGRPLGKENKDIKERDEEAKRVFYS